MSAPDLQKARTKAASLAWIGLAYLVGLVAAVGAGWLFGGQHPLVKAAVADGVGTVVVFGFSKALDNTSVYDPYWSVAPMFLALYFVLAWAPADLSARHVLVLGLVALYGLRLTWNWVRGWPGLHHEDWRYHDVRQRSGAAYWPASFFALHLMPTVLVFGGCLSLWVVATGTRSLSWLDAVAAVVTLAAIGVEATADKQLHRFVRSRPEPGAILETGLWACSRHPNYFGEILVWWGFYLFALAADPVRWWVGGGALAITLLFWFVSIPLIERRMLARRPAYAERAKRVSAIVPWFPSGKSET